MWWQRWCSGQWGKSWFFREISKWTLREQADGDLTRRLQCRCWRWRLRTSPHTSSCNGERGIDIRDRGRWLNRRYWWGPRRTTFCVPIVRYFITWLSRTHDTTPAHYMVMVCLHFASRTYHSYYLGRRIRLPICLSRRQTRTQADNIFAEFRRAVPKKIKLTGFTTRGCPSRRWYCVWLFTCHPCNLTLPFFSIHQPSH